MSPATMEPSATSLKSAGLSDEEIRLVQQTRIKARKVPLVERIRAEAPPGAKVNPPLKFRLLQGTHTDEDIRTGRERTWIFDDPSNNVIETYKQLDQFNTPGFQAKYELIDGGPTSAASPYEPLSGESREDYSKRLNELLAKQLAAFDSNSSTLLSAEQTQPSSPSNHGGSGGSVAPGKPIDQMNDVELRQLAKTEGVDLSRFTGNRDALAKLLKKELKA